MDNISRIIREEINKYIISEDIDFNGLQTLANELNGNSLGIISNASSDKSFDKNLRRYFESVSIYCVQIIAAINRCIQSQNLNEASFGGGLSSYGINLPGVLGGNIVSDFNQGYRNTKNWAMGGTNYTNGKAYSKNGNVNGRQVPSVKLSVLLSQLPQKRQDYTRYDTSYGISNNAQISAAFNEILGNGGIVEKIQTEYQAQFANTQTNTPQTNNTQPNGTQTNNAQGTNP